MKRVVFILLTVCLLLLSEAITLLSTKAASMQPAIQVQSLDFYYKQDEKARYLELKNQWQSEHRGEIPLRNAAELATQAYAQADTEAPLERWRYQGGPSPEVFNSKIHLFNSSKQALLHIPLRITLRARVGELRINPQTELTDYTHLANTAHWQTIAVETKSIPALAPGEDLQVANTTFQLLDFLGKHPGHWPAQLEIEVKVPQLGANRKTISLTPDHFVVPILY
jgi:hypothetical protein